MPTMDLDHYRLKIQYKGLEGFSEIGFRKRSVLLADLFPTADELILAMKAYFLKVDKSAAIIYEIPDMRFEVVDSNRVLDLAVPDSRGDSVGMIIDVLGLDLDNAHLMMDDIETTCGFVRAKAREAMGIMEMSEDDYIRRLRDSTKLLLGKLRPHDGG